MHNQHNPTECGLQFPVGNGQNDEGEQHRIDKEMDQREPDELAKKFVYLHELLLNFVLREDQSGQLSVVDRLAFRCAEALDLLADVAEFL